MISTTDRQAINQALAKAIAYKNCGKEEAAAEWAIKLIQLLELKHILKNEHEANRIYSPLN